MMNKKFNIILILCVIIISAMFALLYWFKGGKHQVVTSDKTGIYDTGLINNKSFIVDSITKAAYNRLKYENKYSLTEDIWQKAAAIEKEYLITDSSRVSRQDTMLIFKIANGEEFILRNDSFGITDETVVYHVLMDIPEIACWLVFEMYYEGSGYRLVSQTDGKSFSVYGIPLFSPAGGYFVCSSSDIEAAYNVNGIQGWSYENNKLKQLFAILVDDWGPEEIKWSGDTMLYIKQSFWKTGGAVGSRYGKMKFGY